MTTRAMNNAIKTGDLVLYHGGLFRVLNVHMEYVSIGDLTIHKSEVKKADWRDITRITKGGFNHGI